MPEDQATQDRLLSPFRKEAEELVSHEWAGNMNEEYGPFPGDKITSYTPQDMFDPVVGNRAPMATDCVQFALWLLNGNWATLEMGLGESPRFSREALAKLGLEWTGE